MHLAAAACLLLALSASACTRLGFRPIRGDAAPTDGAGLADARTDAGGLLDAPTDRPRPEGPVVDRLQERPADASPADLAPVGLTPLSSLSAPFPGLGQAIAQSGDLAVLGTADGSPAVGVTLYSLASTAAPVKLGSFRTDTGPGALNGWGNDVLGVTLAGGRAYLATYYGGVVVLDLDATAGTLSFAGGLHLAKESWTVAVSGARAYVANTGGLIVLDVSGAQPIQVGSLPLAGQPHDVQLVGTTAYLASMSHFQIVSVASPASPTLLGELDLTSVDPTATIYEAWVAGAHAYLVAKESARLLVVDVASPAKPALVWSSPTGPDQYRALDGDSAAGQLVIGVGTNGTGSGSLRLYDLSTPTAPALRAEAQVGSPVYEVTVSGGRVVASCQDGGARVLQITTGP